jgi:histidinol-phosphate aminotransferase
MLDPSYAMFEVYARIFGATAIGVGYDEELSLDAERLLDVVGRDETRVAFIADPNQPTGTLLPEGLVRPLLERARAAATLVFLDEAYWYFARRTALPLVDEFPNLVVARSFSKAGLAGARVGFIAGGEEVVKTIHKVRSAAEVSAFAILCGRKLVAHPEVAEDFADDCDAGARLLADRATALGLTPLPTAANFLQLRMNGVADPRAVVDDLRARGWLVKAGFSTPGLTDCVRVTLGGPDVMAEFAESLADVLA